MAPFPQDVHSSGRLLEMGSKVKGKTFFTTLTQALETLDAFIVFAYVGFRAVVQDQHALMR